MNTKHFKDCRVPIKAWLPFDEIEDGCLKQAKNLAKLPFVYSHVVLLPDCHQGYGMPIGGVIATEGVVIPNAVGVDIGCGMRFVSTTTKVDDIDADTMKKILGDIRASVPVGFKKHQSQCPDSKMPDLRFGTGLPIASREYDHARYQLGTLGGGNHFIELQKSEDGKLCVMIHSGSRNLGKQVADYYNGLAKKEGIIIDPKFDLAALSLETKNGKDYMREMQYCMTFAKANRAAMMDIVVAVLIRNLKQDVKLVDKIDCHHNYATERVVPYDTDKSKWVVVHRKGAIAATQHNIGIIPGSQGTPSYIVQGLDNEESFYSSSHGAGRRMGRGQAIRELDLEKETSELEMKGILHSIRGKKDLDEAPGSYKDIDKVMSYQEDLVDIMIKLEPIAVVKG